MQKFKTLSSQTSKPQQVPSNRSFIKNLFTICYKSLFKTTLLMGSTGWLIDKVPRHRGEQQSRQACCYECHSPVVVQCNGAPCEVCKSDSEEYSTGINGE